MWASTERNQSIWILAPLKVNQVFEIGSEDLKVEIIFAQNKEPLEP